MYVKWPRMCAGCGETNPDKIFPADYVWKHSETVGGGYGYTTYNIKSMPVQGWLCKSCRSKIVTRYILLIPVWLVMLIGGSIGLFESDVPYPFIPMMAGGMIGSICWIIFRFHPVTHVMQFRPKMSGDPVLHFHNARYKAIFNMLNPDITTKLNHVQTQKEARNVQEFVADLARRLPPSSSQQPQPAPKPQPAPQPQPAIQQQPQNPSGNQQNQSAGNPQVLMCKNCGHIRVLSGSQPEGNISFCEKCGSKLL
nr:hypothetical protein [Candidatus Sigynarchaeota archaeon]